VAPAHSKLSDASEVADCLIHHMASNPPPIKCMRRERASRAPVDTMYHKFEYGLHARDKKSTKMSKKTLMFVNGNAEMWCNWQIKFEDLIQLAPLTTAEQKSDAVLTLFKGKMLKPFKEYTRTIKSLDAVRVQKGKTLWSDEHKFYEVLNRVAKEFFPLKHAYGRQCFYLCYHLYRVYGLPYFPRKFNTQGTLDCRRLPDKSGKRRPKLG
jgi:hypothetical protein